MEEQTRNTIEEYEIKVVGRSGSFDPLRTIPINRQEWFHHVRERLEEEIETDELDDDTVLATATIDEVSYTDPDTGECDVRYEARYEVEVEAAVSA